MKLTQRRSGTTVKMSPENRAPAPSCAAAVEVDPGVDQRDAVADLAGVAVPEDDRVVGPCDPPAVLGVDVDRRVEGVRPFDHGTVEMRVTDRDRADAAQLADLCEHVIVDVGDHVPQHVPPGRAHQQGALADGSRRRGADTHHTGAFLLDPAAVASRTQLGERGPLLPVPADVLTFIQADRAVRARTAVLNTAGFADGKARIHVTTYSQPPRPGRDGAATGCAPVPQGTAVEHRCSTSSPLIHTSPGTGRPAAAAGPATRTGTTRPDGDHRPAGRRRPAAHPDRRDRPREIPPPGRSPSPL